MREDAGGIGIVVLVLMNSLARDVVVTLLTLDDTASGRFSQFGTYVNHYLLFFQIPHVCSWDGLHFCISKPDI